MKPYEVNVFDTDYTLQYSTVIDPSAFVHKQDLVSLDKNTLKVSKDFNPVNGSEPNGWYIRISGNGQEYQGIITGLTRSEHYNTITYVDPIKALDINVLVNPGTILEYTVEAYIAQVITDEFQNGSDLKQRIKGIAITYASATSGSLEYTDTDDDYTAINVLDDLITAAFETYSIVTKAVIDFENQQFNIDIRKNNTAVKMIEADLPNVIGRSFNFKNSKTVNRVDVFDNYISPPTEYQNFLHSNGSYDADGSSDRITPVSNKIMMVNGWNVAKSVINNRIDAEGKRMVELNNLTRRLTDAEYSELNTLVTKYMNPYAARNPLDTPEVANATTTYISTSTSPGTAQNFHESINNRAEWVDNPGTYETGSTLNVYTNILIGHIYLTAQVNTTRKRIDTTDPMEPYVISSDSFWYEQGVYDENVFKSALDLYKKSAEYTTAIENEYSSALASWIQNKVEEIFSGSENNNLIELTVMHDDSLINPLELGFGQEAQIIHDGHIYSTVLTGRDINKGKVVLTFGRIRLELTKKLKGGLK